MKKTIFLILPLGMSVRNFLQGLFYRELCQHFRVIIYSTFNEGLSFRRKFGGEEVELRPIDGPRSLSERIGIKLHSIFLEYNRQALCMKINGYTMRSMLGDRNLNKLKERFIVFCARFGSSFLTLVNMITSWLLAKSKYWHLEIDRFKPVAIISTHPFAMSDITATAVAEKCHIPVFGIIHSWDNLTSKGRLLGKFDWISVWSQQGYDHMRLCYPDFPKDRIFISGVPQYDIFLSDDLYQSREEFCEENALDPQAKIVSYICNGPGRFYHIDNQRQIIEDLLKILENTNSNYNLAVRLNPHYSMPEIQLNGIDPGKVIQHRPKTGFSARGYEYGEKPVWDSDMDVNRQFANLMRHGDLLVCVASTAILDALIFNTPVINVLYDGHDVLEEKSSISRYAKYDHLIDICKSKGLCTVYNVKDFAEAVSYYLDDPNADSNQRAELLDYHCGPLDCRAGHRLSDIIIKKYS